MSSVFLPLLLAVTPFLVGVSQAGYDPYSDLAQLYRMQLLSNAFDGYVPENLALDSRAIEESSSYWPELTAGLEGGDQGSAKLQSIYNDPSYSGAHIRDQEHLEHSALHGYQSVSGNNKGGGTYRHGYRWV